MSIRVNRRRLLLAAGAGVLAVTIVPSALGGTGIGAVFNLGKTNSVNRTTTLTGSSTTRMLQVTNASSTGAALQLTTKAGAPPMKVNSSVKVTNLNADKLDGLDSTAFMAAGANPDAATLDGIDSTGFVQPAGQILIQAGASSWTPFYPSDPITFTHYSGSLHVAAPGPGNYYLASSPDLPSVMFGKALRVTAVEFCYTASANAVLSYVEINTQTSTSGTGTQTQQFTSDTDYSDTACHYYPLSAPALLDAETTVNLYVQLAFASAATFDVGRATFVLEATSNDAVVPTSIVVTSDAIGQGARSHFQTTPTK